MHGKFTFMSDQGYSVVNYYYFIFWSSSSCDFVKKVIVEDRIESDHMAVGLYSNFYTDPESCVGKQAQDKKQNIFWHEDK